jgi:ankyrin repeat protein
VIDAVLAGGANIEARDDQGWSPLEHAINGGSPEVLTRVLDAKPKLDAVNDKGRQPLHFLGDLRRLEEPDLLPLAQLLVARGADKKAKTTDGKTAADFAKARGFTKLAAALR